MTEETIEEIMDRHSKEFDEFQKSESTDEGRVSTASLEKPEEKKPDVDKPKQEDWKDGYDDYDKKPKDNKEGRLIFQENEIEVTESDD